MNLFLHAVAEGRLHRKGRVQNFVQRTFFVRNLVGRTGGPVLLIQVVFIDGVGQLFETPFNLRPVSDVFGNRQKHLDGPIKFAPRIQVAAFLERPLPRVEVLVGLANRKFTVGGTRQAGKRSGAGGGFVGVQIQGGIQTGGNQTCRGQSGRIGDRLRRENLRRAHRRHEEAAELLRLRIGGCTTGE